MICVGDLSRDQDAFWADMIVPSGLLLDKDQRSSLVQEASHVEETILCLGSYSPCGGIRGWLSVFQRRRNIRVQTQPSVRAKNFPSISFNLKIWEYNLFVGTLCASFILYFFYSCYRLNIQLYPNISVLAHMYQFFQIF